jgi:hypothetical protein
VVEVTVPTTVRRTALWSIYMGAMLAAIGTLGLLGTAFFAVELLSSFGGLLWFALLALGGGLVWLPVVWLGFSIRRLGDAMLRMKPEAASEARFLHQAAVVVHLTLIGIATAVLLNVDQGPRAIGVALVVGYAAVSFAHVVAMRRCAAQLAAR